MRRIKTTIPAIQPTTIPMIAPTVSGSEPDESTRVDASNESAENDRVRPAKTVWVFRIRASERNWVVDCDVEGSALDCNVVSCWDWTESGSSFDDEVEMMRIGS